MNNAIIQNWGDENNIVGIVDSSDTSWTDYNVVSGNIYYYRLTSVDTVSIQNESFFSDTIVVVPKTHQTEWYVNDTSTSNDRFTLSTGDDINGNGTETSPYATINKALSLSASGDTIYIDAGNYYDIISIDTRNITLYGSDSTTTIIAVSTGNTGITIDNIDNVYITNIQIKNANQAISIQNSEKHCIHNNIFSTTLNSTGAVYVSQCSGVIICSNMIYDNKTGVYFNSSQYSAVSNNTIFDNSITGIDYNNSSNNNIFGNRCYSNTTAINLEASNYNIIKTNHCYDNQKGISINNSSNNKLLSNEIYNNHIGNGIEFMNTSSNSIGNNNIIKNKTGIYFNTSDNNKINNNYIAYNYLYGIEISFSDNNNFYQNYINNSGIYNVYMSGSSSGDIFYWNNIISDSNYQVRKTTNNTNDLSYNHWGTINELNIKNSINDDYDILQWIPYRFNFIDTDQMSDSIAPKSSLGLYYDTSISNTIRLTWENPVSDESGNELTDQKGIRIYRIKDYVTADVWGNTDNIIVDLSGNDTEWIDTDVSIDNTYFYRLTVYDTSGNESYFSDTVFGRPVYNGPEWYVSIDTGNDNSVGSEQYPFKTLRKALTTLHQYDTVILYPGTYIENIEIDTDNVSLIGTDSGSCIINGNNSDTGVILSYGKTGISIEHVNIINSNIGIFLQDCRNSNISYVMCSNINDSFGIILDTCESVIINNSSICTNPTITGIALSNCTECVIEQNSINYNLGGIALYLSSNNTISKNCIAGNSNGGLYLWHYCDSNLLYNNNFSFNKNSDYEVPGLNIKDNCNNNIISYNTFVNEFIGILIENEYNNSNILQYNTISNNDSYGIFVADTTYYLVVDSNVISSNGTTGIYANNLFYSVIRGNIIKSNVSIGLFINYGFHNTITGNLISENNNGVFLLNTANSAFITNSICTNINYQIVLSYGCWDIIFKKNNIYSHTLDSESNVINLTSDTFDFSYNWWNTYNPYSIYNSIKSDSTRFIYQPYLYGPIDISLGGDSTAPEQLDNIEVRALTAQKVIITWNNPNDIDFAGVRIFRLVNQPDTINWYPDNYLVADISKDYTSWVDTDVSEGDYYYYRFMTYDSHDTINYSTLGDTYSTYIPFSGYVWYVNDTETSSDLFTSSIGNDSNTGIPTSPFRTVSYALTKAQPSDTIYIDAGYYSERNIIEYTGISLIGSDSQYTIIDGSNTGTINYTIAVENGEGFSIQNITVINGYHNLYLKNCPKSVVTNCSFGYAENHGIVLEESDTSIIDFNSINKSGEIGVFVYNCSGCVVKNNIVKTNNIGMNLNRSSNNVISNNIIDTNVSAGLMLYYSDSNLIIENTITNHLGNTSKNGITAGLYSVKNTIISNNISNNDGDGIYMSYKSDSYIIKDNIITQNNYGIRIMNENFNTHIENNLICNNTAHGVYITNINNSVIQDNIISNNTENGLTLVDGTNIYITRNTVSNNLLNGVMISKITNSIIITNHIDTNAGYQLYIYNNCYNDTITKNNICPSPSAFDKGVYYFVNTPIDLSDNYWSTKNEYEISLMVKEYYNSMVNWMPYRLNIIDISPNSDTIAPSTPTDINIDTSVSNKILISWHNPDKDEKGNTLNDFGGINIYRIINSTSSCEWNLLTTITDNSMSYEDNIFDNGIIYSYRLTAFDTNDFINESFFSDSVYIKFYNEAPYIYPDIPNQSGVEDTGTWEFNLSDYGHDTDNGLLTWTVTTPGDIVYAEIVNNNILRITPYQHANGVENITLYLSDYAATVSQTIDIYLESRDDSPVIYPIIPIQNVIEDTSLWELDLRYHYIEYDDDDVTWSVTNGTIVDVSVTDNNKLRFIPRTDVNGSDTVIIYLSDGNSTVSQQIDIIIYPQQDTPVITLSDTEWIIEEDTGLYTVTLSGYDSDSETLYWNIYSEDILAEIYLTEDILNIKPKTDRYGYETITLFLSDNIDTVSETIVIRIVPVNDTPFIFPEIPDLIKIYNMDTWSIDLNQFGNDTDADQLFWNITGEYNFVYIPIIDEGILYLNSTGIYTGIETFTIYLSDGLETTFQNFTLTMIDNNNPPVIQTVVPNQIQIEDTAEWILDLSEYEYDTDNHRLYWYYSGNPEYSKIDISNNVITFLPVTNAVGTDTITLFLTDGLDTVSQILTITLTAVNDTPYIDTSLLMLSGIEDMSDWYIYLPDYINDPDNDTIFYTCTYTNIDVVIEGDTLEIIPAKNQNGYGTITLTVSDSIETECKNITVKIISVNDSPMFYNTISKQTNYEDADRWSINLNDYCTDADNDTLIWSVISHSDIIHVYISRDTLYFQPVLNRYGTGTITIFIGDGKELIKQDVEVSILPVNDTPVISPAINNIVLNTISTSKTIELYDYENDFDNNDLIWSAIWSDTYFSIDITNETMMITPKSAGSDTIQIMLSDNFSTFTQSLMILIIDINNPPVIYPAVPDQSQYEDTNIWSVNLSEYGHDSDPQLLEWSIIGDTDIVTYTIENNVIEFCPVSDKNGIETYVLFLTDGYETVHQTIIMNIIPVNDTPVITPVIPSQVTFINNDSWILSLEENYIDTDGDTIFWNYRSDTGFVEIVLNDNDINFQLTTNDIGTGNITVYLSDGNSTVSQEILVNVIDKNNPPVIFPVIPGQVSSEDTVSWSIALDDYSFDSDYHQLFWSVDTTSKIAKIYISENKLFIKPLKDKYGSDTITLYLSDSFDTVSQEISIILNPVNDKPYIYFVIPDIIRIKNQDSLIMELNDYANDIDSDTLVWLLNSTGILGDYIITDYHTLIISPDTDTLGSETITLFLMDQELSSDRQDINITILNDNDTPYINSEIPVQVQNEDVDTWSIYLTDYFGDSNGHNLYWSYINSDTLVHLKIEDDTLLIIPVHNAVGTEVITLRVTDTLDTISTLITIRLNPQNDTPEIFPSIPDQIIYKSDDYKKVGLLPYSRDVDGDSLTWSVVTNNDRIIASIIGNETLYLSPTAYTYISETITLILTDNNTSTSQIIKVTALSRSKYRLELIYSYDDTPVKMINNSNIFIQCIPDVNNETDIIFTVFSSDDNKTLQLEIDDTISYEHTFVADGRNALVFTLSKLGRTVLQKSTVINTDWSPPEYNFLNLYNDIYLFDTFISVNGQVSDFSGTYYVTYKFNDNGWNQVEWDTSNYFHIDLILEEINLPQKLIIKTADRYDNILYDTTVIYYVKLDSSVQIIQDKSPYPVITIDSTVTFCYMILGSGLNDTGPDSISMIIPNEHGYTNYLDIDMKDTNGVVTFVIRNAENEVLNNKISVSSAQESIGFLSTREYSNCKSTIYEYNINKSGNEIKEFDSVTGKFEIPISVSDKRCSLFQLIDTDNIWINLSDTIDLEQTDNYMQVRLNHFSIYGIFPITTKLAENLHDIVIFPNPYKPTDGISKTGTEFTGTVTPYNTTGIHITGLPVDAEIKIYTLLGELIKEVSLIPNSGMTIWDGKNNNNQDVASGIYFMVVTSGEEYCTKKIVIIK